MKTLLVLLTCLPAVHSILSAFFYEWIEKTYGKDIADRLNRKDLGDQGSFGGGDHPNMYVMVDKYFSAEK